MLMFDSMPRRRLMVKDLSSNADEQGNWVGTVKRAFYSIRDHPTRLYDDKSLGGVKYVGAILLSVRAAESATWHVASCCAVRLRSACHL